MEFANNKNYGEKQQQQGKRKANDDQQPAAIDEKRPPAEKDRKMDCEDDCWNDDPNLEEVCIHIGLKLCNSKK
jgi:hypothetical protein